MNRRGGKTLDQRLVALVILAGAAFGQDGGFAAERPNILLIVSEDNGPELGCYGDPFVRTPVLDRLAAEGVRFEHAYVPQAGCSQSRAALLTGLYPHQNGQIGLATWKFRMYREDTPNLVRSLKEAGYRTALMGKLHVNPDSAFPFDERLLPSSNFPRNYLDEYAPTAERFMRASSTPFFLSVNYPDAHRPFKRQAAGLPHNPLEPNDVKPLAYMGLDSPELREATANYYNCLSRLDSLIGELLAALERNNLTERTLVVYLGDHGADLLRGKRTSYEGGVRIPLIIRWPGVAGPKMVRRELVSSLDLAPTILAAAGAAPLPNAAGESLIALLRDRPTKWRQYLHTEFHLHSPKNFYPQRTVRNAQFKLIQNLEPDRTNPGASLTWSSFFPKSRHALEVAAPQVRQAYALMEKPPAWELYDLQADPFEFKNLAGDPAYRGDLVQLQQQLATWRKETADPLLNGDNLQRLKAEVEACKVDGVYHEELLKLTYPDYFFSSSTSSN